MDTCAPGSGIGRCLLATRSSCPIRDFWSCVPGRWGGGGGPISATSEEWVAKSRRRRKDRSSQRRFRISVFRHSGSRHSRLPSRRTAPGNARKSRPLCRPRLRSTKDSASDGFAEISAGLEFLRGIRAFYFAPDVRGRLKYWRGALCSLGAQADAEVTDCDDIRRNRRKIPVQQDECRLVCRLPACSPGGIEQRICVSDV